MTYTNDWCSIEVDWQAGHLWTRFKDGTVCEAAAQDDERYVATAIELGYGDSVEGRGQMAVHNDLLHTFVCQRAGLPFCPVLWGTAHTRWWFLWEAEDNAVLAIQALMHDRQVPEWRERALADYLRWCRPKTTRDRLIDEARQWLGQFRS